MLQRNSNKLVHLNLRDRVYELPHIEFMSLSADQIKVNKCMCRSKVSIASFTTTQQ